MAFKKNFNLGEKGRGRWSAVVQSANNVQVFIYSPITHLFLFLVSLHCVWWVLLLRKALVSTWLSCRAPGRNKKLLPPPLFDYVIFRDIYDDVIFGKMSKAIHDDFLLEKTSPGHHWIRTLDNLIHLGGIDYVFIDVSSKIRLMKVFLCIILFYSMMKRTLQAAFFYFLSKFT